MPAKLTAYTGMDALTHAVEAYTSKRANPLTDPYAVDAVKRIFQSLPAVYRDAGCASDRESMAIAAYEGGRVHQQRVGDDRARHEPPHRREVPRAARPFQRDAVSPVPALCGKAGARSATPNWPAPSGSQTTARPTNRPRRR